MTSLFTCTLNLIYFTFFLQEMNDLTEYVLNRFMNLAKNDPYSAAMQLYGIELKDER